MIDRKPPSLAAAAAAILLAAAAAPPVLAHDRGDHHERTERIIIMSDSAHGPETAGRVHALDHDGARIVDCAGNHKVVDQSTGEGRERTRIVLCDHGNATAADRAQRLEHALARIEANDELSSEHKAQVSAALREAIERLRSAR